MRISTPPWPTFPKSCAEPDRRALRIRPGSCWSTCASRNRDMLEFSRNPKHVSPEWPEGYWPKSPEPENAAAWDQSVKSFQHDLSAMRKLVSDPKSDLFTPFRAWGRTDAASRGAATGGSQRVSRRGVDLPSAASRRLEVKCWRKMQGRCAICQTLCLELGEGLRRPGASIRSGEISDYLRELNEDDCASLRETSDLWKTWRRIQEHRILSATRRRCRDYRPRPSQIRTD